MPDKCLYLTYEPQTKHFTERHSIMRQKIWMKRFVALLLIVAMLIPSTNSSVAYAASAEPEYIVAATASLSDSLIYLRVGKSKNIKCNGTTGTMTWKSSKKSVATVDKNGKVTAVKPGKAIITVTGGNLIGTLTCEVRVSKKITQKQAQKKLLSLKSKYPEGKSWTNENNYYYWNATNCYCYGCIALAGEFSDKIFGKYAPVKSHTNFDKIKIGDHVRIGNYHSVIVLKKTDNAITVVEGNYNSSVHWNRVITKRELKRSEFYVDTRY